MGVQLVFDANTLGVFLAGCAFIALAAWLFFLDPGDRLNRALALLLFLRGAMNLAPAVQHTDQRGFGQTVGNYCALALVFAIVYFLLQYRHRLRGKPVPRFAGWILIALAVAVDAIYFFDHELMYGAEASGPLFVLNASRIPLYALVAWILARDATSAPTPAQRTSLFLVSLAFVLDALFLGILNTGQVLYAYRDFIGPGRAWLTVSTFMWPAAAALSALALTQAVRWDAPVAERRLRRRYIGLSLMALASALLALFLIVFGPTRALGFTVSLVFDGVWTLALPILVSYALLRHQLFGFDARVKITIRRGTVAAVFIAAFLVTTQIAQNAFSDRLGVAYGGVAAGLLLFALAPIQRAAERFAQTAMPDVQPHNALTPRQRLDLYAEQVQVAWSDGSISVKERRLLDLTRERLGVSAEDALRVERDALDALALAKA